MHGNPSATPLSMVQEVLWRHTDRNPADAGAVMGMVNEALDTLGGKAPTLTAGIAKGLDPNTPGGMGLENVVLLQEVCALPDNPDASRVSQWGAISLMGVLAMSYRHDANRATVPDPAMLRSQVCATIARFSLGQLADHTADPQYREAAHAFLGLAGEVRAEDIIAEFELLGSADAAQQPDNDAAAYDARQETASLTDNDSGEQLSEQGNTISEPFNMTIVALSRSIQTALSKMDWLRTDFKLTDLQARNVYRDGKVIAEVVDFTGGNNTLQKLMNEVEVSAVRDRFWRIVANAVANQVIKGRGKSLEDAKVPTLYAGGRSRGDNIMRAYFVQLGNGLGSTPVFALTAGVITKSSQEKALRYLTTGPPRNFHA